MTTKAELSLARQVLAMADTKWNGEEIVAVHYPVDLTAVIVLAGGREVVCHGLFAAEIRKAGQS